jgi:hypothetical protein
LHTSPITVSPRVERLMTDIAWAYRYSLRAICASTICAEHDIHQIFT